MLLDRQNCFLLVVDVQERLAPAVSSRRTNDKETALERLRDNTIGLVATEMVIFEWLERGDDEAFGDLLPMIKGEAVTPARSEHCRSVTR